MQPLWAEWVFSPILVGTTAARFSGNCLRGRFLPSGLAVSNICGTAPPSGVHCSILPDARKRPGSRRLRNGTSFPHDARATLADRGERVQHGGADLQEHLPTMAHDLARGLKQPPSHGLHLRTLPSASKGMGA